MEALKGIGLPEADQKTVMTRLASVYRDPFEGLTTEYKQEKYYKENFNYLVNVHSNITQATHHIYLLQHHVNACVSCRNLLDASLGHVWYKRVGW